MYIFNTRPQSREQITLADTPTKCTGWHVTNNRYSQRHDTLINPQILRSKNCIQSIQNGRMTKRISARADENLEIW